MGDLLFWLALQAIVVSWGLECPRPPCLCFDVGLPEKGRPLTVGLGRACVLVERPCNHDQCTQFTFYIRFNLQCYVYVDCVLSF